MGRFGICIVLLLLACSLAAGLRTLKANQLEPASQSTITVSRFASDSFLADSATTGAAQVTGSVAVNVPGTAALSANGFTLSGPSVSVTTPSFTAQSNQGVEVLASQTVDIAVDKSFSLSTGGSLHAETQSLKVQSDSLIISSDGLLFQSALNTNVFADDFAKVSGVDVTLRGTDGVDVYTSKVVNFFGGDFQAAADVIDLDSFGDFTLQTTGNIRMRGGKIARVEANTVALSGTTGVDVTSKESSTTVRAATAFSAVSSAGTIAVVAEDDISIKGSTTTITADKTIQATGSFADFASSTVNVQIDQLSVTGSAVTAQASNSVSIKSATQAILVGTTSVDSISNTITLGSSTTINIGGGNQTYLYGLGLTSVVATTKFSAAATGDLRFQGDRVAVTAPISSNFIADKTLSFYAATTTLGHATLTATASNPSDTATQSVSITGGSVSIKGAALTVTGGAVEYSAGNVLSISSSKDTKIATDSFVATSTASKGSVVWAGNNSFQSKSDAQTFTSLIGDIRLSAQDVTLQSSNTSVSFAGRNLSSKSTGDTTGTANQVELLSTVTDVNIGTLAGPVSFTALNGTFSATAGRGIRTASPFQATSITTTTGDVSFTQTEKFRWVSSVSFSATTKQQLAITESGSIVGTSGSTNDILLATTTKATWQSTDLLVNGKKVALGSQNLAVNAQTIYVRSEQQQPLTFATKVATISSSVGSIDVRSVTDSSSITAATTAKLLATAAIIERGATAATLEATTGTLSFTTTNMTLSSFGDISLFTRSSDITFVSGKDFTINNTRSFLLNAGTALTFNADNVTISATTFRLDGTQPLAQATTYQATNIITTAGTITQTGGSISLQSADAIKLEAYKRTILSGKTLFDLSTIQNVTLLGTSGIFSAANLVAVASGTRRQTSMRFNGTQVFVFSDSGNDMQVNSAQRIVLTSGNEQPISFSGVSDRIVSAGLLDVTANGAIRNAQRNNSLESISFETKRDGANTVLYASEGALNLIAPNLIRFNSTATGFFTANGLVSTVDDISVVTKAKDNGGGINVQSYGVTHDPIFGTDTGITLHSEAKGDVIIKSEKNHVIVASQTNADLTSTTGSLELFSGSNTSFRSTQNTNIIAEEGSVSLTAQLSDVTLTTGKDFVAQATRNATIVAQTQLTLRTTQKITDPNNVALEFGSDSGDLVIAAQGLPSLIEWTSVGDTTILAGGDIGVTANTDFTVNSATGYIQLASQAGTTVNVTDGQLAVRAQQNVLIDSSRNSNIAIVGGQDQSWSAGSGQIYHVSKGEFVMRTSGNDLELRAKAATGDVIVSGTANIAFQADGTDNTVAGGGIDGIFINAQNIDLSARNVQTWESLGSVIVGSRSNARVAIETGGDTTNNRGFTSTSEGNTVFTTQQSVTADAAYGLHINATSEVTIDTQGAVLVDSLGTSGVGKDVSVQSLGGQVYLHGASANLQAKQSATFQSGGVLQLRSVGTDQTLNQIKAESGNRFDVDVDRRWKVDAGIWNVLTNSFSVQIDNEVVLRTAINSKGNVVIGAQELLQFEADYSINVAASGGAVSLTFDAYSPNSPIEMSADDATSHMLLTSSGAMSASAATTVTVSGKLGVDIVAYDNSLAGTAGDVSFDTYGTYESVAGGTLQLVGSKAVKIDSTGGVKDIELSSTGTMSTLSRQSTSIRAERGDLQVISGRHLEFNTISDSQNGSISLSSATHLSLHSHLNANLTSDRDDFAIKAAQNVLFIVERQGATFRTTKTDASVVVNNVAGGIDINGFTGGVLTGGYTDFTASRRITLSALGTASTGITVKSTELHGTLTFRADRTPTGQDNTMFLTSSAGKMAWVAPGTQVGQGWIDIDSLGTITTTSVAGTTFSAARGSLRTNGSGGVKITSSGKTVAFTSAGSVNGLGINLQTLSSTNGAINLLSAGKSTITAANNITFSGTANTSPGARVAMRGLQGVTFNSGAIDGRGFEAYSTVPGSPVVLNARNLETAHLKLTATNVVSLDGSQRVVIEVPEGIDQGDIFTLKMTAQAINLVSYGGDLNQITGAREGVVIKTVFESAVYVHPTTTLQLEAGDSLRATASNRLALVGGAITTTSAAGTSLSAFTQLLLTANTVQLNSVQATRIAGSSITVGAGTTTTVTVGNTATSPTSEEPLVLQAQGSVTFTGRGVSFQTSRNRAIDITSDSILRIPFIFPRDAGFAHVPPNSAGCATTTLYGGTGSFFYSPFFQQLCYCTYTNALVCYN